MLKKVKDRVWNWLPVFLKPRCHFAEYFPIVREQTETNQNDENIYECVSNLRIIKIHHDRF